MNFDFFNQNVQKSKIREANSHVPDILDIAKVICDQNSKAGNDRTKYFQFKFNQKPRIPSDIVFCIGGWNAKPNGPTTRIEILDIRQQKWSLCSKLSLPEPRAYHGSIVMNNVLYLFGGYDGFDYLNDLVVFDLINQVWTQKASMNEARCYISATSLNGKVYAIGGYDGTQRLREVESFDPAANSWTRLRPMRLVRSDACAVTHKGRIYVIGGFTGLTVLPSIEIYTPETNEWTFGPPLNTARSGVTGLVHGNKIYAFGGFNGQQRLQTGWWKRKDYSSAMLRKLSNPSSYFSWMLRPRQRYTDVGVHGTNAYTTIQLLGSSHTRSNYDNGWFRWDNRDQWDRDILPPTKCLASGISNEDQAKCPYSLCH